MSFLKRLTSNENFKEIISGSLASLTTKALGIVLNYTLIYVITTKIGVAYVGFYNILLVFLFLTTIVTSGGLSFAIIPLIHQFSNSRKTLYKKSLKIIFLLLIAACLLFYALSPNISNYLFSKFDNTVYGIIILMVLYVFLFFNIEYLRANKKIIISESLRNITFPLLILISIFLLENIFKNQFQLILTSVFIAAVVNLIPSFLFSIKSSEKELNKENVVSFKKMFNTATPLMIMGLSSFFLSEACLFILKYYYNIKEVGNFTIIYKISIVACLIFTVSSAIIGPKISELFWQNRKKEMQKTFFSSFKMILLFSLPFFVLVLLFPSFFLNIFKLDTTFSLSLLIMLSGQFLYGITAIFGLFLMVTDKQKVFRNIYIISAILNLILGFLLIPKYSVLGATISVTISYITLNVLSLIYVYKNKLL